MMFCLATGSKTNGTNRQWVEISETINPNKPFLLSGGLLLVFCNGKYRGQQVIKAGQGLKSSPALC
jgi:hypothetical protein